MISNAIDKTDVLLEALPYIQHFHEKVIVIKYGGSALEDEAIRRFVLQDIVFMHYVGLRPVLVHGGGPFINKALKDSGIKVVFKDGIRITDSETLFIVREQLSKLNQAIVKDLQSLGCASEGLVDLHGVVRASALSKDLGWVGSIISINTNPVFSLLSRNEVPVLAPLGIDRKRQVYNINADMVAADLAAALGAEKLVFLTNVDGVIENGNLISSMSLSDIKEKVANGIITGGMLPKVSSGITAMEKGVNKVHIVNANLRHGLLLEIFTKEGIGTEIVAEDG